MGQNGRLRGLYIKEVMELRHGDSGILPFLDSLGEWGLPS
jgi:hypothetical protein